MKFLDIGQERATIGFDDDVKITPFNIEEELEEGHYDETGCFHWKKKDVRIPRSFTDSINESLLGWDSGLRTVSEYLLFYIWFDIG